MTINLPDLSWSLRRNREICRTKLTGDTRTHYCLPVWRQQYRQDGKADRLLQRSAGEARLGSTSEGKREAGNVVAKVEFCDGAKVAKWVATKVRQLPEVAISDCLQVRIKSFMHRHMIKSAPIAAIY
ncbi:hypothetical protein, partial [Mesorhizobium sp. M0633]|uniref:hypothetical protein n=1 Tax=Mesorhizobium sp. M0633 TaxID=2956977 RepID=UPI003338A854